MVREPHSPVRPWAPMSLWDATSVDSRHRIAELPHSKSGDPHIIQLGRLRRLPRMPGVAEATGKGKVIG